MNENAKYFMVLLWHSSVGAAFEAYNLSLVEANKRATQVRETEGFPAYVLDQEGDTPHAQKDSDQCPECCARFRVIIAAAKVEASAMVRQVLDPASTNEN